MFPSLRFSNITKVRPFQAKPEAQVVPVPRVRSTALRRIVERLGKRTVAIYGVLYLLVALSEAFGVSMLFPILMFLQEGEEAFDAQNLPFYLSWILSLAPAMGLPINLVSLIAMALVPILLRQVFKMAVAIYSAKIEVGITAKLRNEAYSSFIQTDLPFFATNRHGSLMSVLILEAGMSGELASAVLAMAGTALVIAVYLAMLLLISPWMTLVAIATGLLATLVVTVLILPRSHRHGAVVSRSHDELTNSMTEGLSGIRIVKMLAEEQSISGLVAKANDSWRRGREKLRVYQAATSSVVEPIFVLGIFLILYVGAEVLGVGFATLGILFLTLLRIMPLANMVNSQRQTYVSSLASFENYSKTVKEALDSTKITSGTVPFKGLTRSIDFDHVGYSYYSDNWDGWALRDITMTIPKGKMIAFVGRSGAGKSTLVDLIPRLRDAITGEVRIDGVNLKELDLKDLRRSIGFVSQDTFLFNDTIQYNIAFGLPSATPEQVKEAARRAYAHDFISETPHGYETMVGDRGVRLSAGQRQRLGIARVMLQDPDIIILDEPTSALDSESENYIRAGLDELRKEKTLIVIAHRLSTIQQADEIIVLDDGRIVERGNHKLLLDRNGDYSRLFDLQIHGYSS